MQRLVFTNYHKFIGMAQSLTNLNHFKMCKRITLDFCVPRFTAATTTVKSLNADVAATDADMRGLFQNIDEIGARATGIEQRLAPHKTKVEQLVGVRRLLKRVEFLFELPARLAKSVELGAYAQAVRYHRVAARLLSQVLHTAGVSVAERDAVQSLALDILPSLGNKSFIFICKRNSSRIYLCICKNYV